jgi:hypothetical protein
MRLLQRRAVGAIVGAGLLIVASVLYALEAGGPRVAGIPLVAWIAGLAGCMGAARGVATALKPSPNSSSKLPLQAGVRLARHRGARARRGAARWTFRSRASWRRHCRARRSRAIARWWKRS